MAATTKPPNHFRYDKNTRIHAIEIELKWNRNAKKKKKNGMNH